MTDPFYSSIGNGYAPGEEIPPIAVPVRFGAAASPGVRPTLARPDVRQAETLKIRVFRRTGYTVYTSIHSDKDRETRCMALFPNYVEHERKKEDMPRSTGQ